MRFCHASALRWEDVDERRSVILVQRKNVPGLVGPVSRKKRAPRTIPLHANVIEVLRWHRQQLIAAQHPGLSSGYMFPSRVGTLRQPNSVYKAWQGCLRLRASRGGSQRTGWATPSSTSPVGPTLIRW
jgi:integrase